MSISLNRVFMDPELVDVLSGLQKEIFLSLNCHAIATIQSFNPLLQTATATINYKKTYLVADPNTGIFSEKLVDYPMLLDCPVVIMQGGGGAITFPIEAGDNCLVLFNDRCIDGWFASGQVGPIPVQRFHSFADGILLVGISPVNDPFLNYDTSRVVLRNGATGTTMVGVGEALIKIANATTTLKTVINGILDLIAAAQCTSPGSPLSNAAAFTAYKTTVEGLLE